MEEPFLILKERAVFGESLAEPWAHLRINPKVAG